MTEDGPGVGGDPASLPDGSWAKGTLLSPQTRRGWHTLLGAAWPKGEWPEGLMLTSGQLLRTAWSLGSRPPRGKVWA